MDAVSINLKYLYNNSNDINSVKKVNNVGTFAIKSIESELRIKDDTPLIFSLPENEEEDLKFISEGIITKVGNIEKHFPSKREVDKNKEKGQPPPKTIYYHNYTFNIKRLLTNNNMLSELEYSIKDVNRYNKPIVHFQQQYRILPKSDYETIINGWVYASRTVFGKLINAIPRQNKLEFMLEAMNKFSTIDFKNVPLTQGLNFLYEYIDRRILSRGRIIVDTNNIIQNELSDVIPIEEIGFKDPNTGNENTLLPQATIFAKLFALEKKSDLRTIVNKTISENAEMEQRFMRIFQNETWPIDLQI